jgi:hypothetical protein
VAYYVPLGSRGILLRIGTSLISVLNGWVYSRAYRRRRLSPLLIPVVVRMPKNFPS